MGGQTAFHYTAGSCWTLLFAVVVWATTHVLECIKTITGRGFPSFGSQSAGKPTPARMHIITTLHIHVSQGGKGELLDKCRAISRTLAHAQHLTSAPPRAQDCLLHIPTCPRGQTPEAVILRFLIALVSPAVLPLTFVRVMRRLVHDGRPLTAYTERHVMDGAAPTRPMGTDSQSFPLQMLEDCHSSQLAASVDHQ